jgi:hypothetical protein
MVKCGYAECKNHLNGWFNPYHVPECLCVETMAGETFYCCEDHHDMCR